jgi:hypothetical protein
MNDDGSRSSWIWVAWGCGGCLVLTGLVLVALIFAGVHMVKNIESEMNDPVAREAKAREVLGVESIPAGYFPILTFSVPFVFDTVVLGDQPPGERGELSDATERVFVYVELIRGDRQWKRYADGGDPSAVLEQQGIRMHRGEEIGRGEVTVHGLPIDYISQRGELTVHDHEFEGISTFVFIRCPNSKRMRAGVWNQPDPDEATPVGEVDFSGTNADPEVIRAFLSNFDFCGA